MGILPVGLGCALLWLLVALVPMRSPSARRAWGKGILGVSVLLVLVAALFGANVEVRSDYEGPSPLLFAVLGAAIVVAPGAIVAVIRSGRT